MTAVPGSRPLAVVGATASGKSAVAMALARRLGDVELVSVDSMQVYRGMDIGTAKPSPAERAEVTHHGLDLVDPWEEFDLRSFQTTVRTALADIAARGRRAVLVGGTGLYLRAVVDDLDLPGRYPDAAAEAAAEADTEALHRRLAELDPTAAARMEPTNRRRIVRALEVTLGSGRPFSSFGPGLGHYPPSGVDLVGLRVRRPVLAERIAERFRRQAAAGFLDEVRRLTAGPPLSRTAGQALGYRELAAHLEGAHTLEEAEELAIARTRRFARRQRVWFERDPRIAWLDGEDDPAAVADRLVSGLDGAPGANTGRSATTGCDTGRE